MIHEKKETRKAIKEHYDDLNEHAEKNAGAFAMMGKELLKGNPQHISQMDGVHSNIDKKSTVIMGHKIR